MRKVFAIAGVVIKEIYRRKDFYVLFVLVALITLMLGGASLFSADNVVRSIREICLLLIWISALVIAITTTARQIPAERENRTIFPLLAKPVSRGQVIVGKFLGCWLATGVALLVFYIFLGVVSAAHEHQLPVLNYFQAMFLQWVMLGVVVAMALLGSIVFAAPSSNGTICLVVVVGILLLGGHLNTVALRQTPVSRDILYTIYYLIPHLEWFDVRNLIIHAQGTVAWVDCGLATIYAAVYAAFFLFAAWTLFRRKALNT
jgi:ABC-type transport system involved in multi-copper enzyme maturation permease subunit